MLRDMHRHNRHPFWLLVSLIVLGLPPAGTTDEVRVTVYHDGQSCPANCDAHVVFHPSLNGTAHAARPGTRRAMCRIGELCRLCMDDFHQDCIEAVFRGDGPSRQVFDFTPAFIATVCERGPSQSDLARVCRQADEVAEVLQDRVNCIAEPSNVRCRRLMERARYRKATDQRAYNHCKRIGESAFNAGKLDSLKRSNDCAYEYVPTGGPNSKGIRWRRLQPGACGDGSFVGDNGLDCCTGHVDADKFFDQECQRFYR